MSGSTAPGRSGCAPAPDTSRSRRHPAGPRSSAPATLTVGAVAGDADVKNLNGKTWIGRVGGDVKVKSANGDVTIDDAGRDVTVKTANGNIRLGQVARGSVTIETASGGLEIGVKEGTAAWIDATTKFGRVHNHLTSADDPDTVSRDRPGSRPDLVRRRH